MAGQPPDAPPQHLRPSEPRNALGKEQLAALARCHQLCLPHTASSRAGLAVLEALYSALDRDPGACVIWHPPFTGERHLGAFASGTANLRETEAATRRYLSPFLLARLALRVAGMPMHILSRRRWEHVIPRREIGYVLTVGVAGAVAGERGGVSGHDVLAELERWFIEHACRESWVDTELDNRRAIEFYERNGYREVSRAFGQVLLKKSLPPD